MLPFDTITMRPTEETQIVKDTTGWPTSSEVSDRLGVSLVTVLTWKRKGKLKPVKTKRKHPNGGVRDVDVYDPRDVERCATERRQASAKDPGECAARVFEMLDLGKSSREIVTALRITPDCAEELRERWLDLGGSDIVISPVAQTELEKHVGPFQGIAGLVARVAELAGVSGVAIATDGLGSDSTEAP